MQYAKDEKYLMQIWKICEVKIKSTVLFFFMLDIKMLCSTDKSWWVLRTKKTHTHTQEPNGINKSERPKRFNITTCLRFLVYTKIKKNE